MSPTDPNSIGQQSRRNSTCASSDPEPTLLPTLSPGVTCLDNPDSLVGPLHALVFDQLLETSGRGWWIDVGGYARTTSLRRLAPTRRTLDRLHVARAFTPYQQQTLVQTLPQRFGSSDESDGPSIVVCPAVDGLVATPGRDCGPETAQQLRMTVLATVSRIARDYDCPVLLTRTGTESELQTAVGRAADRSLRCELTPHGPRFTGDGFETRLYPPDANGWSQTTLAYWADLLAARVDVTAHDPTAATQEVSRRGSH